MHQSAQSPDHVPWAPLGATRVGGSIGALLGAAAVINFGHDAAWIMVLSAVVGAVVGFNFDRNTRAHAD